MSFTKFQGNNVADGPQTPSQNYDTRYATALKLFSGEVYNAFNDATIFKGLIRNYNLLADRKAWRWLSHCWYPYRSYRWPEFQREDDRDG